MIIREATLNDVDGLVPLWLELMHYHAPISYVFEVSEGHAVLARKDVQDMVENKHVKFFVAEENGDLLGYVTCSVLDRSSAMRYTRRGQIEGAYVRAKNKGTGTLLVNKTKEWFKSEHVEFMTLMVAIKNDAGVAFWKKMGFDPLNHFMVQELK
jgi:ribosomal protein S18 acetylase RimI-like enzyme